MNISEELNKVVQKALQEKTFTKEVLQEITNLSNKYNKIINKNKNLIDKIGERNEEIKRQRDELEKTNKKLQEVTESRNVYESREQELKDRELHVAIDQGIIGAQHERLNDMKWMIETVFKNNTIKRTIHEEGHIPMRYESYTDPYGNHCGGYTSQEQTDKTTTIEEER